MNKHLAIISVEFVSGGIDPAIVADSIVRALQSDGFVANLEDVLSPEDSDE